MPRILVIDDDPDIRPLLRIALSKFGHQVALAARGEEGVQAALATNFDLIVLDLMMPDLDGYEVTRRLRAEERTKAVPIILLTARTQTADYEGALEAGADAYMPKPFDPESLNRKIGELLKENTERKAVAESGAATSAQGRVTVVWHLRGGVGATTCAVNLAGMLARAGRRTCLLDLSPVNGHVSLHLRLNVTSSWADLPRQPDTTAVAQTLLKHESGLLTLAAPTQPTRKALSLETFRAALDSMRIFFPEVVVDAAPQLDEVTCAALGAATQVLVVCSPEIGAVRTTIGAMQALPDLIPATTKTFVVLNYPSPDLTLPVTAVEKALGRAPDLVIPNDRLQMPALAQGAPLVFANPKAPFPSILGAFAASNLMAT
jgi:DNA-binding response OmpR family regulator